MTKVIELQVALRNLDEQVSKAQAELSYLAETVYYAKLLGIIVTPESTGLNISLVF